MRRETKSSRLGVLWHFFANLVGDVADRRHRTELSYLFILARLNNFQTCTDQLLKLQHLGELFLGQQIYLQGQMRTLISTLTHSVLLYENKGRKQYTFQRN